MIPFQASLCSTFPLPVSYRLPPQVIHGNRPAKSPRHAIFPPPGNGKVNGRTVAASILASPELLPGVPFPIFAKA